MVAQHQTLYAEKYRNPKTGEGLLDQAFRDRDPELLQQCLDDLRGMSRWFMQEASKRYAAKLAELR